MNMFSEVLTISKEQITRNIKTIYIFLVVNVVLVLVEFSGVVLSLLNSASIVTFDKSFGDIIFSWHTPFGNIFFKAITLLCGTQAVAVVFLAAIGIMLAFKHKKYIFPFIVSAFGSSVFTALNKVMVARLRPILPALTIEDSFSFPSGHATAAVGVYAFLIFLILRSLKNKISRTAVVVFGFVFIILVGISRVYLGVHYLTDVLAGYAVGMLFFWVGTKLVKADGVI